MRFIDLFAGLGGFHQALDKFESECVFASEINSSLAELYERNFGVKPEGDIRAVDVHSIPDHDLMCAGFPCQPFSKAGDQKGLECPQWGDLIDYVVAILKVKTPRFFILENVPNLVKHNGGETWRVICQKLVDAGYDIRDAKISPHMFGVPQKRERAFIIGDREGLADFSWPLPEELPNTSITTILDKNPNDALVLNSDHIKYLENWQEFINVFPKDQELPSFPIWSMEFGADYPLDSATPHAKNYEGFSGYKGAFGKPLRGLTLSQVEAQLPGYARSKLNRFPAWKIDFIEKNRAFYQKHQKIIDPLLPVIQRFPPSFQKLEWNIKGGERNIWKHIIQFRASGIRVKKTDAAPSLIAMTTSQVPIVTWEKRYMTPRECSRLQGMENLSHFPKTKNEAYKAFGNAVNVDVVKHIMGALLDRNACQPSNSNPLAA